MDHIIFQIIVWSARNSLTKLWNYNEHLIPPVEFKLKYLGFESADQYANEAVYFLYI